MTNEQTILNELFTIKRMLAKMVGVNQPPEPVENDFTRAKRAALDAREKATERRLLREAAKA